MSWTLLKQLLHFHQLMQQSLTNTFVREAGIDYKKALFVEKANSNSKQWYNLIAAKKDWKSSDKAKAIEAIIKAYHTDNVKKASKNLQTVWTNQLVIERMIERWRRFSLPLIVYSRRK